MKIKTLPGTVIELSPSEHSVRNLLSSLFLAGGLVLSQISSLTDLSSHVLQNWVKRGFIPPPVNKKYSKRQFCRIIIINLLKDSLQIEGIVKLIGYVNGNLSDISDDLIDDSELYCYFVETITLADMDINKLDSSIKTVFEEYKEPFPGEREKITSVVKIMSILYISSQIKNSAELLIANLN